MRRADEDAMPPDVPAALLAVDATLAGEPVDPEYADLAELALILRGDTPAVDETFASALDERVERRFARPARPARMRFGRGRGWRFGSAAGLAAACAVIAVIVVTGHGQTGGKVANGAAARPQFSASPAVTSASSSAAAAAPAGASGRSRAVRPAASSASAGSAGSAPSAASAGSAASSGSSGSVRDLAAPARAAAAALAPAPSPAPTGKRQIVQSAQVQLSTSPAHIDAVSQQVFDVVTAEKGIVESSNVTATGNANGNADFQLSVPSPNLAQTLTALSSLHGANVVSRSDATNDITGQLGGAGQRLAEARALRRSLLKQLANAVSQTQVDSLKLQLRGADASIASDLSTLRGLQRQVAYSRVTVSIQATAVVAPSHSSSFTIGRAAHDAGRVLVVAAGAALIALAVLVPVGLVVALLAWVGLAIRRHRRDQALDLV